MPSTYRRYAAVVTVLGTVILAQACRHKSAVTSTDHVRGTVESLEGQVLTVATASGSGTGAAGAIDESRDSRSI